MQQTENSIDVMQAVVENLKTSLRKTAIQFDISFKSVHNILMCTTQQDDFDHCNECCELMMVAACEKNLDLAKRVTCTKLLGLIIM